GPGSRVGRGAGSAARAAVALELSEDVAAVALLCLLLQQEEAREADHGHGGGSVSRARAVPHGNLQHATIEDARSLRLWCVVVPRGVALVSDILLVAVGNVTRDDVGRPAIGDAERRRLLCGKHIRRILRLRSSHGTGVVSEARIDALGGRTGLVAGLRLHVVA